MISRIFILKKPNLKGRDSILTLMYKLYSQNVVNNFENKPLTQLQGITPADIVIYFKQKARELSPRQKHQLRKQILVDETMRKTKSMSVELQVRHFHLEYPFQDEYEAFFLTSCLKYHTWNINYIAKQISANGELKCPQCKTICSNTLNILPDALIMSIFNQAKHYSGTKLIFKNKAASLIEAQQAQLNQRFNDTQTLIQVEQNGVRHWQKVKVQIIQFVKDERLSSLSVETLGEILKQSKNKISQKFEKDLRLLSTPIVCNLICFDSQVRIRNPLVHRYCSPQNHDNKLILFSFQHIYFQLFLNSQTKILKIKCLFQSCPNYFDKDNFREVGLVLPNLHARVYEQENQNIIGLYFAGGYTKNWYLGLGYSKLTEQFNPSHKANELFNDFKMMLNDLVATTSLREGAKRAKKVQKKLKTQKAEISSHQNRELEEDMHQVHLKSEAIFCPVRCYKCSNLDAIDALDLFLYLKKIKPLVKCPLCGYQFKKKLFYECFYYDTYLAAFIFNYSSTSDLFYNASNSKYLQKISDFTGETLKNHIRQAGRIYKQKIPIEQYEIVLPKAKNFVVVVDRRCMQISGDSNLMAHALFLEEKYKIQEQPLCPSCRRISRLNTLTHLQQVQMLLLLHNNDLRHLSKAYSFQKQSITALKYYQDIKQRTQVPDGKLIFYWWSYQCQIIRNPFVFKGCKHSFQTSICDFADIQYQIRMEGCIRFKCRYMKCNKQYEYVDEMMRVQLPIHQILTSNKTLKNKMTVNKKYWIQVDPPDKVQIVENIPKAMREEEKNYRTKQHFWSEKKRQLQIVQKMIQQITFKISSIANLNGQQLETKVQLNRELQTQQKQKKDLQKLLLPVNINYPNQLDVQNLKKQYPTHIQNLSQKNEKPVIRKTKVDHTGIKTHGNLQLFKYPIPSTSTSAQILQEFKIHQLH